MNAAPGGCRLSKAEAGCLIAVAVVAGVSLVLSLVNRHYFETVFTDEDQFVENLTAVALAASAAVCGYRAWVLRRRRSRLFLSVTVVLAVMYGTAAGEEISWGQRVFHAPTPKFFAAHNAQKEINLHNLSVGGLQVKRVVEVARGIVLTVYWMLLPLVWPWWRRPRVVADRLGIPVPRLRHGIAWVLGSLLVILIPSVRRGEVDECVIAMVAFVVTAFPANGATFGRSPS